MRAGVPHLRRWGSCWTRTQPLRAGLTCGAPPALSRKAPQDSSSDRVILGRMSTEPDGFQSRELLVRTLHACLYSTNEKKSGGPSRLPSKIGASKVNKPPHSKVENQC